RQGAIGDHSEHRDRQHQEARRNRPPNKVLGDVHACLTGLGRRSLLLLSPATAVLTRIVPPTLTSSATAPAVTDHYPASRRQAQLALRDYRLARFEPGLDDHVGVHSRSGGHVPR